MLLFSQIWIRSYVSTVSDPQELLCFESLERSNLEARIER